MGTNAETLKIMHRTIALMEEAHEEHQLEWLSSKAEIEAFTVQINMLRIHTDGL